MTEPENHNYPRGTVEFVTATVASADVDLDTQLVYIALSRADASSHDWLAAHWLAAAGATRKARTDAPVTFGDTYPHSTYDVFVKVTDDPEAPIIRAGSLTIS